MLGQSESMLSLSSGSGWSRVSESVLSVCVFQALFNRLLLLEPGNHLIYMTSCSKANLSADRHAGEKSAVPYLYACYQRAKEEVRTVSPAHQHTVAAYIILNFVMAGWLTGNILMYAVSD